MKEEFPGVSDEEIIGIIEKRKGFRAGVKMDVAKLHAQLQAATAAPKEGSKAGGILVGKAAEHGTFLRVSTLSRRLRAVTSKT